MAGIVLVGRTMGIVASWGERVALCVGVIASAAVILAVAKYTPTEPSERASAIAFCQKTVEGALPDGSGRFLSDQNAGR